MEKLLLKSHLFYHPQIGDNIRDDLKYIYILYNIIIYTIEWHIMMTGRGNSFILPQRDETRFITDPLSP